MAVNVCYSPSTGTQKMIMNNSSVLPTHILLIFSPWVSVTGYVCGYVFVSLSPPKPLDHSTNVTVGTFHIWRGSVHEQIFLALGVPSAM